MLGVRLSRSGCSFGRAEQVGREGFMVANDTRETFQSVSLRKKKKKSIIQTEKTLIRCKLLATRLVLQ